MRLPLRLFFLITWFIFFLPLWSLSPQKLHASDVEGTKIELYRFSITVPDELIRLDQSLVPGDALLVLTPPKGRFPNFNVVYSAGDLDIEKQSSSELERKLLNSYEQVGILKAKIVTSERVRVSDRSALKANIRYLLQGQPVQSSVTMVADHQGVYYLTMLDFVSNTNNSAPLYESLLSSFQLSSNAVAQEASTSNSIDPSGSTSTAWMPGVIFVVVAFVLAMLLYRRKKSS